MKSGSHAVGVDVDSLRGLSKNVVRDATEAEGWDVLRKGKPCRAGDQAWLWGSPGRGIAAGKPRGPHVVVPTAAAKPHKQPPADPLPDASNEPTGDIRGPAPSSERGERGCPPAGDHRKCPPQQILPARSPGTRGMVYSVLTLQSQGAPAPRVSSAPDNRPPPAAAGLKRPASAPTRGGSFYDALRRTPAGPRPLRPVPKPGRQTSGSSVPSTARQVPRADPVGLRVTNTGVVDPDPCGGRGCQNRRESADEQARAGPSVPALGILRGVSSPGCKSSGNPVSSTAASLDPGPGQALRSADPVGLRAANTGVGRRELPDEQARASPSVPALGILRGVSGPGSGSGASTAASLDPGPGQSMRSADPVGLRVANTGVADLTPRGGRGCKKCESPGEQARAGLSMQATAAGTHDPTPAVAARVWESLQLVARGCSDGDCRAELACAVLEFLTAPGVGDTLLGVPGPVLATIRTIKPAITSGIFADNPVSAAMFKPTHGWGPGSEAGLNEKPGCGAAGDAVDAEVRHWVAKRTAELKNKTAWRTACTAAAMRDVVLADVAQRDFRKNYARAREGPAAKRGPHATFLTRTASLMLPVAFRAWRALARGSAARRRFAERNLRWRALRRRRRQCFASWAAAARAGAAERATRGRDRFVAAYQRLHADNEALLLQAEHAAAALEASELKRGSLRDELRDALLEASEHAYKHPLVFDLRKSLHSPTGRALYSGFISFNRPDFTLLSHGIAAGAPGAGGDAAAIEADPAYYAATVQKGVPIRKEEWAPAAVLRLWLSDVLARVARAADAGGAPPPEGEVPADEADGPGAGARVRVVCTPGLKRAWERRKESPAGRWGVAYGDGAGLSVLEDWADMTAGHWYSALCLLAGPAVAAVARRVVPKMARGGGGGADLSPRDRDVQPPPRSGGPPAVALPPVGAWPTTLGADMPLQGAAKPTQGADLQLQGAAKPTQGADLPLQGVAKLTQGADMPLQGVAKSTQGADKSLQGDPAPGGSRVLREAASNALDPDMLLETLAGASAPALQQLNWCVLKFLNVSDDASREKFEACDADTCSLIAGKLLLFHLLATTLPGPVAAIRTAAYATPPWQTPGLLRGQSPATTFGKTAPSPEAHARPSTLFALLTSGASPAHAAFRSYVAKVQTTRSISPRSPATAAFSSTPRGQPLGAETLERGGKQATPSILLTWAALQLHSESLNGDTQPANASKTEIPDGWAEWWKPSGRAPSAHPHDAPAAIGDALCLGRGLWRLVQLAHTVSKPHQTAGVRLYLPTRGLDDPASDAGLIHFKHAGFLLKALRITDPSPECLPPLTIDSLATATDDVKLVYFVLLYTAAWRRALGGKKPATDVLAVASHRSPKRSLRNRPASKMALKAAMDTAVASAAPPKVWLPEPTIVYAMLSGAVAGMPSATAEAVHPLVFACVELGERLKNIYIVFSTLHVTAGFDRAAAVRLFADAGLLGRQEADGDAPGAQTVWASMAARFQQLDNTAPRVGSVQLPTRQGPEKTAAADCELPSEEDVPSAPFTFTLAALVECFDACLPVVGCTEEPVHSGGGESPPQGPNASTDGGNPVPEGGDWRSPCAATAPQTAERAGAEGSLTFVGLVELLARLAMRAARAAGAGDGGSEAEQELAQCLGGSSALRGLAEGAVCSRGFRDVAACLVERIGGDGRPLPVLADLYSPEGQRAAGRVEPAAASFFKERSESLTLIALLQDRVLAVPDLIDAFREGSVFPGVVESPVVVTRVLALLDLIAAEPHLGYPEEHAALDPGSDPMCKARPRSSLSSPSARAVSDSLLIDRAADSPGITFATFIELLYVLSLASTPSPFLTNATRFEYFCCDRLFPLLGRHPDDVFAA
ncbi:hypothetical protein DIPPA_27856 [Diplonema papillatum]|nr:hypothetical protein DIPPA_27856 [Diplonema papillatum]